MRSCEELVRSLSSGSPSSEHQQAMTELLALPLSPQTWITTVGAIPALVQMITQPGTAAAGELAMQALHRLSGYMPQRDSGTVRTALSGVIAAIVPLLRRHSSREDVLSLVTLILSSLSRNSDNRRQLVEAGAIAPLVQLLKSSSMLVHIPAAMTLSYLLKGDSISIRAAVFAAGAAAPLVLLLKSNTQVAVQTPVVMALKALCYEIEHTAVIARAGAVTPLVRLLASECVELHEAVLEALVGLARNEDIVGTILAVSGAIPHIVKLLISSSVAVQELAATALARLVNGREAQSTMLAAGAIPPLVRLLKSSLPRVTSAAAQALSYLATDNAEGQAKIVAAGAIVPLTLLLKAAGSEQLFSGLAQGHAAMALVYLADSSAATAAKIVSAGAISLLIYLFPSTAAQSQAALAVKILAQHNITHDSLFAAGILPPLLRLAVSSTAENAQEQAMAALLHLADSPAFPHQLLAADAIPLLVRLLPSESAGVREKAMLLLGILTVKDSRDLFAAINSAGAQPILTRLRSSPCSSDVMKRAYATLLQRLRGSSASAATTSAASLSSALAPASAPSSAPAPTLASAATLAATALPSTAASGQLPPRPRRSCWSCGATGVPLKKCSVCAVAAYCGAGCQKTDWKAHKGQCAGLKAGASGSGSAALGAEVLGHQDLEMDT